MSNYLIGDYIRDTRLRRGYTQEQLSFGICTTASLSRIETGAQAPGKHILDALMERLGMSLYDATSATSFYFISRTFGCLLGTLILRLMSPKSFFGFSVIMMLVAMVGLFIFHDKTMIYTCIALIGFGNSNVFSVIFSQALLYLPGKKNEVSGLMIMGLFGGTVFPLAMGVASDAIGQNGAVAVMTIGVLYLLFFTFRIRK